jgi:ribonuclease J
MRVRIHRGAKEVGGNCIELVSNGYTLLLDLGMPLSSVDPSAIKLPSVAGLDGSDAKFLGLVITHPHFDHYGLALRLPEQVKVFIGRDAYKLLRAAIPFSSFGAEFKDVEHYQHRHPFNLGPFRITPFLNDHSAFDAYSLLIEADGRRLFYTGDFRGHGRKAALFEQLLMSGPKSIDVLLTEGTTINRADADESKSENELEKDIAHSLAETQGMALAYFSAQNIDRFVTFFKASKQAGRTFVVDVYLAHILDALALPSLPSPRGPDLLVFLPYVMKLKIKRQESFELVNPYRARRIFSEELGSRADRLTMLFRPSMATDLEQAGCLDGARLFYSLWPGYLERDGPDLRAWCASHGVGFEIVHTSGHAGITDLRRLVEALDPGRVVPIHTAAPERFLKLFANARLFGDGEWWEV